MNVIKNRVLSGIMRIFGVNPMVLQEVLNKEMGAEVRSVDSLSVRDEPKIIYQRHRKAKVNNSVAYHYYTAKDRQYFKTPKGKRPIKITAREAIIILNYKSEGFSTSEIYELIDFHHPINIATLESWLRQYEKGLMDLSLSWICDNHVDDISVDKKCYLKR